MDKRFQLGLLGGLLLLLLPFLLLCFFVWPSSDDYAMGYLMHAHRENAWSVVQNLYMTWGGRYSTLLGAMLSPVVVKYLWLYRLLLVLTLALLFASLVWFFGGLLHKKGFRHFVSAASFLLLWLQVVPGLADSFYWHSGVVVYTWPLIFFFSAMGFLLRNNTGTMCLVPAGVALFLLVGFNEMAAALALLTALAFALPSLHTRNLWKRWWGVVAVMAGMALLLLSPGNAVRMQLFEGGRQFFPALYISLVSWVKLNGIHIQSIPLWLLSFLLFALLHRENFSPRLQKLLAWHPVWVLLAGQGILLGLLFIPAWSMGINPPLRVYNFLSPLWLLWLLWLLISLREKCSAAILTNWPSFYGNGLKTMVIIVVIALMGSFVKIPGGDLVFGGNVPHAWYDLVMRAPGYNRAMQQREILIEEALGKRETALALPALKDPPGTIFFLDMTSDPHHWINPLYARHYGLDLLWVEAE